MSQQPQEAEPLALEYHSVRRERLTDLSRFS